MGFLLTGPPVQVAVTEELLQVGAYLIAIGKGAQSGPYASLSRRGVSGRVCGGMIFQARRLESSKRFGRLQGRYNIRAGIGGFWAWLDQSSDVEAQESELHQIFQEMQNLQDFTGVANFNMKVDGIGADRDPSAYVLMMQVEDAFGNTYFAASDSDPSGDTGAQDEHGNALPVWSNISSIAL